MMEGVIAVEKGRREIVQDKKRQGKRKDGQVSCDDVKMVDIVRI